MRHFAFTFAVLAVAVILPPDTAHAAGRWHVPSTPCQYMGYGFGPGYHAPMVLGPTWKSWPSNPGVKRVAHPPQAPCQHCTAGYAGFAAGPHAYSTDDFGPSELMPASPTFAPQLQYEAAKAVLPLEPASPSEYAPQLP